MRFYRRLFAGAVAGALALGMWLGSKGLNLGMGGDSEVGLRETPTTSPNVPEKPAEEDEGKAEPADAGGSKSAGETLVVRIEEQTLLVDGRPTSPAEVAELAAREKRDVVIERVNARRGARERLEYALRDKNVHYTLLDSEYNP